MDAIEKDTPIKSIYLNVFQQSQYEIGRLWLENKISVAKEHFCSAATQQIMSQIYPLIFAQQRIGQSFVAANVGGELHEIGIRMVADFFEMDGWDTYYLGANAPASSIIAAIKENNATMVAVNRIIKNANAIKKVRDGVACAFFHPFLDISLLKKLIGGMKAEGFNFIDLREDNNWVKVPDKITITGPGSKSYDLM